MTGAWYRLRLPGSRRPERVWRAQGDPEAYAMALGLVRGEIGRRGGEGVRWSLYALTAGPRSEDLRRVDVW